MTKIYIVFFFLITLIICNENRSSQYEIKLNDVSNKVSLLELFSEVTPVFLETNDECLIKTITDIKYVDNILYILDSRSGVIFTFDSEGNYLYRIDNKGEGRNEYSYIANFNIRGDTIDILASVNNAIYSFNKCGSFLEKTILPTIVGAYDDFIYLNNDIIVFWTFDYENRIKYYSKTKKEIIFETFPEERSLGFSAHQIKNNIIGRDYTNSVYLLENKKPIKNFEWNFGKYNNTKSMVKKMNQIGQERLSFQEYLQIHEKIKKSEIINYVFFRHMKNLNYQYVSLFRKNKFLNLFYNLNDNNYYLFEKTKENVTLYPVFMDDNYLIGTCDRGWEEILNPEFLSPAEQKKLFRYNSETDNPIIVKYTFKNE